MYPEDKYFVRGKEHQIWQRYCGFLDLTVEEFMSIQKELLMDQVERVAGSTLGKKIMNNQKPKNLEEFRRMVPLTSYEDYEPYLSERREDALAVKPEAWCHSSGRRGTFNWIPHSSEFLDVVAKYGLGCFILSSGEEKGSVRIWPGVRCLFILPPAPYASGILFETFARRFTFQPIPPVDIARNLDFTERVRKGFEIALRDGVDVIGALGSILVRMGDEFSEQTRSTKFSSSMLHPRVMLNLGRALLRSKKAKRPILPKDLWRAKAIVTGGVDTSIYKDTIANYWGQPPYEFYVCAEAFFLALQGWNKKGMVFLPDVAFFEFIPYEESPESQDASGYQPRTVLLDELEDGRSYEVVITHFYGMPLLRYRIRDIVKVTALQDDESGVRLPQIAFQCRVGEVINLAGLAQVDEKTMWQAIANTGVKYADWTACKEYDAGQAFLRVYLEPQEHVEVTELETKINEQLKAVDVDYRDIDSYLALQPVRVTLLSRGTFQRYMEAKRKEGADLAHLKPTHISPPESVVQHLLLLSEVQEQ